MVRAPLYVAIGIMLATSTMARTKESPPLPPPYQGVYQPIGVDEIGRWREDDERERILTASPMLIRDETLTNYIKSVLCASVGEDRCDSVRIYVVREPIFNASMTANGTMRVFTGLLLRVRNEAELSAILGHEFGHFEQRHTLNHFKKYRTGTDLLAWGSVLAAMAASLEARQNYQNLELAVYGDLYRYGRDQEREADFLGIAYLNRSQLRPQAASRVWQNVMAEAEASAQVRGLKRPNFSAIAFAASHPPSAERADYLAELADPAGEGRDDGAARYKEMLEPWLPMLLDDQIKLNDFGASEFILENLAEDGWTAPLLFARGELYRRRGNPRDLVFAAEFYSSAVMMDETHSEAHRGLGLTRYKLGQVAAGQSALQRYLELAPEASDASMIRLMLPKKEEE